MYDYMELQGSIYKLTSPSEKNYIGQTINMNKRMSEYKTFHHCENQKKLFRAIKKYGFENFKIEVLETVIAESKLELKERLNNLEIDYIKQYDCVKTGYNICQGGNQHRLGVKETEEQKQKKRDSWTPERRLKQSKERKGQGNARFGKKFGISPFAKQIDQFDLNNNYIQSYPSIKIASEQVLSTTNKKIQFQNIAKVVSGQNKTVGGFIWKLSII